VAVASGKGGSQIHGRRESCTAWAPRAAVDPRRDLRTQQPLMLGLAGQRPVSSDGRRLSPCQSWREAPCRSAFWSMPSSRLVARPDGDAGLTQLLEQTQWEPSITWWSTCPPAPVTCQLTLAQRVPVAGAVIVTIPRTSRWRMPARGEDVREGRGAGARIVENMSVPRLLELRAPPEHISAPVAAPAWHRSTA